MVDRCSLCEESSISASQFCNFHAEIYDILKRSYRLWLEAYDGNLSWHKFLEKVLSLPETGEEAKQVAKRLLAERAESSNASDTPDL